MAVKNIFWSFQSIQRLKSFLSKLLLGGTLNRILSPGCLSLPGTKKMTHSKEKHSRITRAMPQRRDFILQSLIPMKFFFVQETMNSELPQTIALHLLELPPSHTIACLIRVRAASVWRRVKLSTWRTIRSVMQRLRSAIVAQKQPQTEHKPYMCVAVFQ